MMLTAIAFVVKVIAGRSILCHPLFNFFLTCLFFLYQCRSINFFMKIKSLLIKKFSVD